MSTAMERWILWKVLVIAAPAAVSNVCTLGTETFMEIYSPSLLARISQTRCSPAMPPVQTQPHSWRFTTPSSAATPPRSAPTTSARTPRTGSASRATRGTRILMAAGTPALPRGPTVLRAQTTRISCASNPGGVFIQIWCAMATLRYTFIQKIVQITILWLAVSTR